MSGGEVLYKATRTDGTEFRTGTVDYAGACGTGWPVLHPGAAAGRHTVYPGVPFAMIRGNPSTYLSLSAELGEALTGGWWPCRLFRAEPAGEVIGDDDMPWKRCCRSMRIVEEVPAHLALGPNGKAVAALIERARRLRHREIAALADAWRTASPAAARIAAAAAHRQAAFKAARVATAPSVTGEAAGEAARAEVVRDLIPKEQYQALTAPWRAVIG